MVCETELHSPKCSRAAQFPSTQLFLLFFTGKSLQIEENLSSEELAFRDSPKKPWAYMSGFPYGVWDVQEFGHGVDIE